MACPRQSHTQTSLSQCRPDFSVLAVETIVPISALEHFSYCPRQCALIHIEGCFIDNLWTAEGSAAHRRVDAEHTREAGRVLTSLALFSDRLGLIGRADVVEFGLSRVPYPIEYKNTSMRTWRHEAIQVCAQGLCLEEMFGVSVPAGAVYYTHSRRRREITFSPELRSETLKTIRATRELIQSGAIPTLRPEPRCRRCSLKPACLPEVTGRPRAVRTYLASLGRVSDA
jgi:CRISPR-associated exonuclease Cas4